MQAYAFVEINQSYKVSLNDQDRSQYIYIYNRIVQRIAITGIYMVNLFDFFFYKLREQ